MHSPFLGTAIVCLDMSAKNLEIEKETSMKQIKILAIGNSFSEDALHYLHEMASSVGIELKTVNLFVGGCSLERHFRNWETGEKAYMYQVNGIKTN